MLWLGEVEAAVGNSMGDNGSGEWVGGFELQDMPDLIWCLSNCVSAINIV